jgi:hypothetical protein
MEKICNHAISGYHYNELFSINTFMNVNYTESEVLTAVFMKSSISWDITPCSPLKVNRRFGRIYRLYLQDQRICR